jgi:hypothetical protein
MTVILDRLLSTRQTTGQLGHDESLPSCFSYATGVYVLHKEDIDYRLLDDGSEGEVATIVIEVPGATIMVMGELEDVDGGLVVDRTHISISPPDARVLTRKTMGVIAERVLEDTGYGYIIVRGAARTTGARPGHTPRDFRFP